MYSAYTQIDTATLQKARTWVERNKFVLMELCACALRNCRDCRYFIQLPMAQVYPLANSLAADLLTFLEGNPVSREKLGQPFDKLMKNGEVLPAHLYEFLDKLQIFVEESLREGFNKPSEPVKLYVQEQLRYYLHDAQSVITTLAPAPVATQLNVENQVSSFVERFLAKK